MGEKCLQFTIQCNEKHLESCHGTLQFTDMVLYRHGTLQFKLMFVIVVVVSLGLGQVEIAFFITNSLAEHPCLGRKRNERSKPNLNGQEMPNWAKKCQIGLKIQITELQLKVTKYFGQWGKVVYSWVEWCWQKQTALQCANGSAGYKAKLRLAQLHGAQAWHSKENQRRQVH